MLDRYRLDLEDASQTQIARVVRGIWGRNAARGQRQRVLAALERKYRESPYHPLHRRNVVRISDLRAKYAPLFLAQDLSARRIQATARRFLYNARIRWSLAEQRAKFIQQLVRRVVCAFSWVVSTQSFPCSLPLCCCITAISP